MSELSLDICEEFGSRLFGLVVMEALSGVINSQ
jgi:hypothetical protein